MPTTERNLRERRRAQRLLLRMFAHRAAWEKRDVVAQGEEAGLSRRRIERAMMELDIDGRLRIWEDWEGSKPAVKVWRRYDATPPPTHRLTRGRR